MTSTLRNELLYGTRALLRDHLAGGRLIRRLRQHETLSVPALAQLQQSLLHRTLQTAIRRLPYYAHISADFGPAEAHEVLRREFPVITKRTLLDQPAALYPHGGQRRPWQPAGMTSGTTGAPLTVFRSLSSVLIEQAFIKRHWSWVGYAQGMPRATLRGDMVVALDCQQPPFWFWNRYDRQLVLSSRHLTEVHADAIIDRLAALQPAMMQAYPSTAYTLACLLQRRGRTLRIPYILTASEPTYAHQRELVSERLGGQLVDMYGMAERVAFATQCEHGSLHLNPDYSHVEILDEQGQPTDDFGYVVGTTFHNQAMPLVRYQLSDRTRWKPGRCACGRPFPMIEPVTGKVEDALSGSAGQMISPSVLTFAFKGVPHIRKSQVAQVAAGVWEIRLVPDAGFGDAERALLLSNIHHYVDAAITVRVVLRDDLPNTAAGKFRWVVNEIAARGRAE